MTATRLALLAGAISMAGLVGCASDADAPSEAPASPTSGEAVDAGSGTKAMDAPTDQGSGNNR